MKVLLDACIGGSALRALEEAGVDALRVTAPGLGDADVLAWAERDGRVLVTADKDFGEMVLHRPHGRLGLLRLLQLPLSRQAALIVWALDRYGEELSGGAMVIVEERRVRVRRPAR